MPGNKQLPYLLGAPGGVFSPELKNELLERSGGSPGEGMRTAASLLKSAGSMLGVALEVFVTGFTTYAKVMAQIRDMKFAAVGKVYELLLLIHR